MKRLYAMALIAVITFGAGRAVASGMPVVDLVHIAETVATWLAEAKKWKDQLEGMQKQYKQLQDTYKTMKDPRGYVSNLANNWAQRQLRSYMPGDFEQAMNLRHAASPGWGTANRYHNKLRDVMDQYNIGDWDEAYEGLPHASDAGIATYQNKLHGAQAVMAGSLVAQEILPERLSAIDELVDAAGSSDDLKASVDTSSRVTAEVAYLIAENNRLHSQTAFLLANEAQREVHAEYRALRMSQWRPRSW